jgi:triacylglycerol lipase
VALSSAKWGEFDSQLWPADHVEEVGHDLDRLGKTGAFEHLAKYREIVARVQNI